MRTDLIIETTSCINAQNLTQLSNIFGAEFWEKFVNTSACMDYVISNRVMRSWSCFLSVLGLGATIGGVLAGGTGAGLAAAFFASLRIHVAGAAVVKHCF